MKNIQHIYFIGIGGIGMSALARYYNAMGKKVSGYDKTKTKLTADLISEGIDIHFDDDINLIDDKIINPSSSESVLIVYTPAIPNTQSELNYFKEHNFNIKKRSEVLGMITQSTNTIAVAGTHGKTTTSALIAHILKVAGLDPSAFLGGITQNYNTNLLLSESLSQQQLSPDKGDEKLSNVIVEADEYDRSFLTLHPEMAVITSVDADHLDVYGGKEYMEETYSLFANQVKSILILQKKIEKSIITDKTIITYSVDDSTADYYGENINILHAEYHFDIVTPNGIYKNITLGLPGLHNVENSIAAVAIASILSIPEDAIRESLKTFSGVRRRFDYQLKTDAIVFIDDYAHHPEELKACISSAKEMYPSKKITGIFQPHLFSRTRDFADEFAKSLDLLDECILMEIYPARELPIEGVDSQMLLDRMRLPNKSICQRGELLEKVKSMELDVLLTLGAGDIDLMVEPLKNELLKAN